jgi:hypothetical protein
LKVISYWYFHYLKEFFFLFLFEIMSKKLRHIIILRIRRRQIFFVIMTFYFWRFWMTIRNHDYHPETVEISITFKHFFFIFMSKILDTECLTFPFFSEVKVWLFFLRFHKIFYSHLSRSKNPRLGSRRIWQLNPIAGKRRIYPYTEILINKSKNKWNKLIFYLS